MQPSLRPLSKQDVLKISRCGGGGFVARGAVHRDAFFEGIGSTTNQATPGRIVTDRSYGIQLPRTGARGCARVDVLQVEDLFRQLGKAV